VEKPAPAPAPEQPPAPPSEDLPTVPGLDVQDGLGRVAGNRKLYLKLLRQFAQQQGPAVVQIQEALAQGNTALAERLAHTLKGVAGNIGAKQVQTAAGTLERLIRERADSTSVEGAVRVVATVLDPLREGLETAFSVATATVPAAPTPSASPAQTIEAAHRLTTLLSEFDPGAAEFLESNQAALRPLFAAGGWEAFMQLVQSYSFPEAQAQLAQAMQGFATS
jgi:two-component system sensor histidine kinase/response regulator